MQRELAFFEANDAISSGDIAYRITAEASDLAATLYALLNVSFILLLLLSHCHFTHKLWSRTLTLISMGFYEVNFS